MGLKSSIIVTCGYIEKDSEQEQKIELERLLAFSSCLKNLSTLDYSNGDEVVISEWGVKSRLESIAKTTLPSCKYVFTEGTGFNQALAKNAGAEKSSGDILCWINSDVLLSKNVFDELRKTFERDINTFCTAARHDLFVKTNRIHSVIRSINDPTYQRIARILLDDPGWHHALKKPKQTIESDILGWVDPNFQIVHDFLQGYINYGEFMAVSREMWQKKPFEPNISALVDSWLRDVMFHEFNPTLDLIHDRVIVVHLSGSDYMQQEQHGSNKHLRLIKDMRYAIENYDFCEHWAVFSYFPEFDDLIEKKNIQFKQIFEEYCTDFLWKFWKNKKIAMEKYGVSYK